MYSLRTKILDLLSKSRIDYWTEFLMDSQYWTREQINIFQEERFHLLIDHIMSHSPYYMNYCKEKGIQREDIKSLEDIKLFPIMRRDDVSENLNELLADNMDKFNPLKRSTGGTTGEPLVYYSDKEAWSMGWALKLRDWSYSGYRLGEKMGVFAGGSLIPEAGFNLKRAIWNKLTGFHPFPMAHYNDKSFSRALEYLLKNEFKYLRGYPTSILSFAEYIKKTRGNLPMNAIFTTAEVLQEEHRKVIEEVFQTKIFDQYGCADSGGHASETSNDTGFYLSPESAYCEYISKETNYDGEEIVELAFTNWHNFSMPILRYAPGDLANIELSPSQIGRNSNRLKRIIGRTTERIKLGNGNVLAGPAFTLFFRLFELKSYQLEQLSPFAIRVNLVPKSGFKDSDINRIRENIIHHAGNDVEVEINILEKIEASASGKHKFIIAIQ